MDENHKEEQVRRHLKGAARRARRKQREGYASRPDIEVGDQKHKDLQHEGWEAERPGRHRPRRKAKLKQPVPKRATAWVQALVVGVARSQIYVCIGEEREALAAKLAPAMRRTPLVVGDGVLLQPGQPPRVESLVPRRNLLARPDVGNRHRELPIAANLDLGVIVAAYDSPPLRPGLIDRYLIALERAGVRPLLCINKIDLCDSEAKHQALKELLAPYRELGLELIYASTENGQGCSALALRLAGLSAVLVGHSGVGKSSLLGALGAEQVEAVTGPVREFDGRGRHTTSASSLLQLPGGLRLIDTPGVRAFGLVGISPAELCSGFPGFGELAAACRFRDCTHVAEPGCAVLSALAAGQLAASRYGIYLRLLKEVGG